MTIVGGLGNQMFQYAFSLALSSNGEVLRNDFLAKNGQSNYGSELNKVFGLDINNKPFHSLYIWFIRKCIIFYYKKESRFFIFLIKTLRVFGFVVKSDYVKELLVEKEENTKLCIWYGRFQSEVFFSGLEDKVRRSFTFNESLASKETKEIADLIRETNSISLHVRRGDYLTTTNYATFANICTVRFYNDAIEYFFKNVESPIFYIFSDDISWVKANLDLPANTIYIDWNQGEKSWEDMYLMSLCKHNIVANSTFSWWGAWLNANPSKIVICPTKYTNEDDNNDFYPQSWIRITS